jgi:transposase-like protein
VRRDRDFWQQLVSEVDGGEAIAAVARRHRVQPKTLTWWRWKLRAHRPRTRSVDARLLPVVVRQTEPRVDPIVELRVRDVTIRIVGGSDVEYLASLVDALRG